MEKYFRNFTLEIDKNGKTNLPRIGWEGIPNGEYRIKLRANSSDDPVGGYVNWIFEHKKMMNVAEF